MGTGIHRRAVGADAAERHRRSQNEGLQGLHLPEHAAGDADRARRNSRETQEERATALWVYATGYIGDKADVANISALTGIKRAQNMAPGELHVDVINREHPITKGLKEKLAYGTDERVQEIRRPPAASAG
jgi:hypothetical protein